MSTQQAFKNCHRVLSLITGGTTHLHLRLPSPWPDSRVRGAYSLLHEATNVRGLSEHPVLRGQSSAFLPGSSSPPFISLSSEPLRVSTPHQAKYSGVKNDQMASPKHRTGFRGQFCFSPFSRVKCDRSTPQGAKTPSGLDNHFQMMHLETSLPSVLDSGLAVWLSLTSWGGPTPGPPPSLPSAPSPSKLAAPRQHLAGNSRSSQRAHVRTCKFGGNEGLWGCLSWKRNTKWESDPFSCTETC